MRLAPRLILLLAMVMGANQAPADEIRIAVASNFAGACKALADSFEAQSDHEIELSFGSTGKHYAQIVHGAPFDLFFAADTLRPSLLEERGIAEWESRLTYAKGRLVLWSPKEGYVDSTGDVLVDGDFRYLSIANPKLAPYGRAAKEVLEQLGLWEKFENRIVRGENIGQAHQFVMSGNAELGFVSYSQILHPDHALEGSYWIVPPELYGPINQQVVAVRDSPAVRDFYKFLRGSQARRIIESYGYELHHDTRNRCWPRSSR